MTEISFTADCMLGKLSKLLRMCGVDTVYYRGRNDDELAGLTIKENRQLLTRKTQLIHRKDISHQLLLIKDNNPQAQLHQVLKHYKLILNPQCTFTLCLICNQKLLTIEPNEAEGRVPEYVAHTHRIFSQCPRCKKIFWKGTQFEQMQRTIEKISACDPITDITSSPSADHLPGTD